jgi:nitroreductase
MARDGIEPPTPASEGDFLGILSLGCAMENMWLMANSLRIGVHIVSSSSGKKVATEIAKLLNLSDNFSIAFSMRLGYPVTPVYSLRVRRARDDFLCITMDSGNRVLDWPVRSPGYRLAVTGFTRSA